ncbi:MAG: hypothetical protein M1814_005894 [Vezdaea aestivalis]|nr:MAG: hypothetical protein M1814_005894 [Vezdaea aestivalis]
MGHGGRKLSPIAFVVLGLAGLYLVFYRFRSSDKSNDDWSLGRHSFQSKLAGVDESKGYSPVKNETLGFHKIYCISLESRDDKRDAMVLVSSASGIQIDFWNAIKGSDIADKALPANWDRKAYSDEALGCLRSHMNVLRDVIQNRHQSALVIEDDTSWDVSLKQQLMAFAKGVRYVTDSEGSITPLSPYGSNWDMLWLGHCGSKTHPGKLKAFVMEEGPSVPGPHRRVKYGDAPDMSSYSKHTRIVYAAGGGTCTYAYAVSFRGAQRILKHLTAAKGPVDWELGEMCGRNDFKCITPYPPLISEYKAVGSKSKDSDIEHFPSEYRERGFAFNLVFDARLNLDKLLNRQTNFESQWPEDLT